MAGNFPQHMGAAGGNPMMMQQLQQQQAQHQQQGQPQTQALQHLLLQNLQSQPVHQSGWQTGVTLNERLGQVWHIVSQLRLVHSNNLDFHKICTMALQFEKTSFENAPDKPTYLKTLRDKLEQLTQTRNTNSQAQLQAQAQAQAANAQAQAHAQAQAQAQIGMVNQGGLQGQLDRNGMPQQQSQQSFQHLQHQMQASPLSNQQQGQQLPMGMMNNMIPQNIAQPGQQQLLAMQQQHQLAQLQQLQRRSQPGQNRQGLGQNGLPQEQALVADMMSQLMSLASDEEKNAMRANLQARMDPGMLLRYQQQGIDPLVLYYRSQALSRLKQSKEQQQSVEAANQQHQNQGMAAKRNQGGMSMQQQHSGNPNMMNPQGQPLQQMVGNPDFGSFLGSVENLIGQQQQQQQQVGVLGQEAGQMIPANVPQGSVTPQPVGNMPVQVATPNSQQRQAVPNLRAQQQFSAQQAQAGRMNTAQIQGQAQSRATAQAKTQQMALQGQPGGMGPMPPQQSPAMSTLNTPLKTPQSGVQMDQQQMNQTNTPHFGQPIDPRFVQLSQNQRNASNPGAMAGPLFPPNMTQEQREALGKLPPEKLHEVIGKWKERVQQPNQIGRAQGQMPPNLQNIPGGRTNQSSQQIPFNQQGAQNQMVAQFMANGQQPGQRPPQAMMAGMTPQQQMMLQQQMPRFPPQQGQPRNPQAPLTPQEQLTINQIDGMEFPTSIIGNVNFIRQVPPEVKRWGELKQWVSQNPQSNPNALDQLRNLQRIHYQNIIRARNAMERDRQHQQQMGGAQNGQLLGQSQPQSQPMVPPGMAPVAPMGQAKMQGNAPQNFAAMGALQPIQVQEIQKARAHSSGKYSGMSDDEIKNILQKKAYLQRQSQIHQQSMYQQQQLQMAQMAQMTPSQKTPQGSVQRNERSAGQQPSQSQQQMPSQGVKQTGRPQQGQAPQAQMRPQQSAPTDPIQPVSQPSRGTKAQGRGTQASSPPQPQKNLKRSNSDDVVEVPNPNRQQPPRSVPQQTLNQPQGSQQVRNLPNAQQLAAMTPEARKQYDQAMRNRQQGSQQGAQATPEDMQRCHAIYIEEEAKSVQLKEIPMNPELKTAISKALTSSAPKLLSVRRGAVKWFAMTHDEKRLREFFCTFLKIAQQFKDETLKETRESFSITIPDVEHAYKLANGMISDVLAKYPDLSKSRGQALGAQPVLPPGSEAANIQTVQALPAQAVPLNAANLQQQQQALKQQGQNKMHARSNSRNAHPPAAPTTAQPPFSLGSPHGTPVMYGKNEMTQESLRLPPTKKQRHSATSTPALGQQTLGTTAAPQIAKGEAKDDVKQHPAANADAAARNPTVKTKPQFPCPEMDCDHYFNDTFASEEDLAKHRQEEHITPLGDPPKYVLNELATMLGLEADGSFKHPSSNADNTAAATVGNPGSAPLKGASSAKDDTAKDKTSPATKQELVSENLWANSSVNPQDLLHNFQKFEAGAGGAIADMSVYRSITPNDTPESSKDGISEPNSDISDGVELNIMLDVFDETWQPFGAADAADLLDFSNVNVGGPGDVLLLDTNPSTSNFQWDEFLEPSYLDKPFAFDNSMYSMNAE